MYCIHMQPIMIISQNLRLLAGKNTGVFALEDLHAFLPGHLNGAFRSLITRLEKRGELIRVCRGIYILPGSKLHGSDLLGRVAARLRAHQFNYLSLETVLSAAGIISQIPMNRLTLMSSGRSSIISCGDYGSIEFVHTNKTAGQLAAALTYDADCRLWRASASLALKDMRQTRRDTGLIDWKVANELV